MIKLILDLPHYLVVVIDELAEYFAIFHRPNQCRGHFARAVD